MTITCRQQKDDMDMKRLFILIMAVTTVTTIHAQSAIADILAAIEQNNTTLKAGEESMKAQKAGNHTDMTLPDPEIGFGYLWGSPGTIGTRKDVSISQTFDIATISGLKSKVADRKDLLAEWQYKTERMNILLEAKLCCLDIIYYNAMVRELAVRAERAGEIAAARKKSLDNGNGNMLDYNSALLDLAAANAELTRINAGREVAVKQLTRLNGGKSITLSECEFELVDIPKDFNQWYASAETKSPALAYVRQEIEVGKKELALNKAMRLPSFSLGYQGEFVKGEHYQGVTVGISVPLWSNKNKVRQAKAAVRASEAKATDAKQQLYDNLEALFLRTAGLKKTAEEYRSAVKKADNSALLKKALDAGQISIQEYLAGIGLCYDATDRALEAERDYQKSYAELHAVEL